MMSYRRHRARSAKTSDTLDMYVIAGQLRSGLALPSRGPRITCLQSSKSPAPREATGTALCSVQPKRHISAYDVYVVDECGGECCSVFSTPVIIIIIIKAAPAATTL